MRKTTLLEVLADGFEKNEVFEGFHHRTLPMPSTSAVVKQFDALIVEATRWKGKPEREVRESARRLVAWPDLEIRQAGRGITSWWHEDATWADDPLGPAYDWLEDEEGREERASGS